MRTIDDMFADMKKIADEEGYCFNPNPVELNDILDGLWENEHRYGYPSCPCRIAKGVLADDMDMICPCNYRDADVEEYGCCLCVLYVNEDRETRKHDPIPERRPREYYEKGYPSMMEQKGAGGKDMTQVYRCTVCGYLCGREEPPDLCPICRAKKERFEKFEMKI